MHRLNMPGYIPLFKLDVIALPSTKLFVSSGGHARQIENRSNMAFPLFFVSGWVSSLPSALISTKISRDSHTHNCMNNMTLSAPTAQEHDVNTKHCILIQQTYISSFTTTPSILPASHVSTMQDLSVQTVLLLVLLVYVLIAIRITIQFRTAVANIQSVSSLMR